MTLETRQIIRTTNARRQLIPETRACNRQGTITRLFLGARHHKRDGRVRTKSISGSIELEIRKQILWGLLNKSFETKTKHLKFYPLSNGKPMEGFQKWGGMCSSRLLEYKTSTSVLQDLEVIELLMCDIASMAVSHINVLSQRMLDVQQFRALNVYLTNTTEWITN